MTYSKDDVEFRGGSPAVNVKVSFPWDWDVLARKVADDNDLTGEERHMFFEQFTAYIASDPGDDHLFEWACESGWAQLQEEAREIWGYKYVEVHSEGRSGGWAVVSSIGDFDYWNAVQLGKWHRFEKVARALADDIPYVMVDLFLFNDFQRYMDTQPSAASVMLAGSGVGL